MKTGIHPAHGPVAFRDKAAGAAFRAREAVGAAFLTRSTATGSKAVERENGNTHPVVDVEISSASHPFRTGTARVPDTAGRVERFERRYGRSGAK
ncbi:type B 50S ribosomal protein L31 [Streptomyces sp. NPDC127117]|uniref:type B 50S ribosomal protein L31 n=1 Tax=Streptomyces sp. NPDC127117 TaxID=3345368 RepID=UPI00364551F7